MLAALPLWTGGESLVGQVFTMGLICPLPKQRVCLSVVLVAAGYGALLRRRLVDGWVRRERDDDTKPTFKPQNEILSSNDWLC